MQKFCKKNHLKIRGKSDILIHTDLMKAGSKDTKLNEIIYDHAQW